MFRALPLLLLAGTALTVGPPAQADSFRNVSDATGESLQSSAQLSAAGSQVALGAVALPLAAVGAVTEGSGALTTEISDALWETANAPLAVDDDIAIAQPAPSVPREIEDNAQ